VTSHLAADFGFIDSEIRDVILDNSLRPQGQQIVALTLALTLKRSGLGLEDPWPRPWPQTHPWQKYL